MLKDFDRHGIKNDFILHTNTHYPALTGKFLLSFSFSHYAMEQAAPINAADSPKLEI